MKIVFMGTPQFGATILKELIKEHEVVLVVTQPDKEVGRKRIIEFSPVKKVALENNIEVFQPYSIRKEYEYILNFDFDLIVSAAYGQIVGMKLLNYPKYKAINVHGSLLPRGRGGAPIQRAIMDGDKETGITIMYMAKGMDSGDILAQEKLEILDSDNNETLFEKMANLGASMINRVIDDLVNDRITPIKQNEEEVTYTYALTKEDERLNFNRTNFLVNAQIRALSPNIGATFYIDSKAYKVYEAFIDNTIYSGEVGEIVEVNKKSFKVLCKDFKAIEFKTIKPEGKNLMNVSDFLNGQGRNILIKGKKVD